jgi:hypothetical protein
MAPGPCETLVLALTIETEAVRCSLFPLVTHFIIARHSSMPAFKITHLRDRAPSITKLNEYSSYNTLH